MARRLRSPPLHVLVFAVPSPPPTRPDPSIARMKSDLTFLASAECEGRGPGTAGIDKAADYIAGRSRRPASKGPCRTARSSSRSRSSGSPARQGCCRQPHGGGFRHGESQAQCDIQSARRDVVRHGRRPIVFVGYGITSERDSTTTTPASTSTGKVVLMIRKSPRYGETSGSWSMTRRSSRSTMRRAVRLVRRQDQERREAQGGRRSAWSTTPSEKDDKTARLSPEPAAGDAIPAVHIKRSVGDLLLASGMGKSLDEIEQSIEAEHEAAEPAAQGLECQGRGAGRAQVDAGEERRRRARRRRAARQ